jgi:hypothetical protein
MTERLLADKLCAKHKISVEKLLTAIERVREEAAKWRGSPSTEKKLLTDVEMGK